MPEVDHAFATQLRVNACGWKRAAAQLSQIDAAVGHESAHFTVDQIFEAMTENVARLIKR